MTIESIKSHIRKGFQAFSYFLNMPEQKHFNFGGILERKKTADS
jgi:hypothetical protein